MSVLENDIWKESKLCRRRLQMISLYLLLFALVILSIGLFWITQPLPWISVRQNAEQLVSPERLKLHIRKLSEDFFPRHYAHQQNQDRTADYIKQEFEKAGARVSEQKFTVNGEVYRNVIGNLGNPNAEKIVIGAHYDTAGAMPGADDNASGVTGLIELAYLLSKEDLPLQIELVAYNLEEPPFFGSNQMGSYAHAESLSRSNVKIRLMICLEMIGYFSDEPESQNFPISVMNILYPTTGNFIAIVGNVSNGFTTRQLKAEMLRSSDLPVYSMNSPSFVNGVDFSDHRNYWKFGYNAVMITDTAFFRNKNYHSDEDTWEKLDYSRMAKVVEGVFSGIKQIAK